MKLIFRLLWIALFSRFSPKVPLLGPCITPFRCLVNDIDILMHMNNGAYFSLMDLGRVDLMSRAGILINIKKAGWYPVVVSETMKFKKSIPLFKKFEIETTVLGWDEKAFILRQRFLGKDIVYAEALVRARFLKKTGGGVGTRDILNLAEYTDESPILEPWVELWNQNQVT
jgi:acyl-CoA thioesterase FadM